MQMDEALELRRKWKEAGDKPCDHDHMVKERSIHGLTGDRVCTTCGYAEWIQREPQK